MEKYKNPKTNLAKVIIEWIMVMFDILNIVAFIGVVSSNRFEGSFFSILWIMIFILVMISMFSYILWLVFNYDKSVKFNSIYLVARSCCYIYLISLALRDINDTAIITFFSSRFIWDCVWTPQYIKYFLIKKDNNKGVEPLKEDVECLLEVTITQMIDDSFPIIVEAEFEDVQGKLHKLYDKLPIFTDHDFKGPMKGYVRAIAQSYSEKDSIIKVDFSKPDALETSEGIQAVWVNKKRVTVLKQEIKLQGREEPR